MQAVTIKSVFAWPYYHVHAGPLECGDYLSDELKITTLMAEYAEQDKHYDGMTERVLEDSSSPSNEEGPPRPVLQYVLYAEQ